MTGSAWIPSGSRTGRLIASHEWSGSALGPIESWSTALTQAARICLESRFPFAIAWGPERVQLYNDAFANFCGAKHPSALGQDLQQCWRSAWPVLGSFFDQARLGESAYLEDSCLFLDRAGTLEETFATFSFSPLRENDEEASVAGVLLTLLETTEKVLGERRTVLLRDVVTAGAGAPSIHEALARSVQVLDRARRDVPFALVYSLDESGAELVAHTHHAPLSCCAARLALAGGAQGWSGAVAAVAASNRQQRLDDLPARFGFSECGPYAEPPVSAQLLPITLPGAPAPRAVLIAAQSPRLTLNQEYRAFFQRLGAAMSANAVAAHAFEQSNQELEAFSYSVSHDLRTPLRAVDGFSNALLIHKADLLDNEGKDYLFRVRRAAARMGELIDELLGLSRVSRAPLRRCTISLTKLATQVASNLQEHEPTRDVAFDADADVLTYADPSLLRIVLENLLSNSWKFTRHQPSPKVRVGRFGTADNLTFFVEDNGAGFDQAHAQRLFQPFQRLHLERDYPGTGIGLAIVHRIVTRHGGRVWAEGRENQGATFYFTFPETP